MTHPTEALPQAADEPNLTQRDEWDQGQPHYDAYADRWEQIWAPFGQAMFDAARLQRHIGDRDQAAAYRRRRR